MTELRAKPSRDLVDAFLRRLKANPLLAGAFIVVAAVGALAGLKSDLLSLFPGRDSQPLAVKLNITWHGRDSSVALSAMLTSQIEQPLMIRCVTFMLRDSLGGGEDLRLFSKEDSLTALAPYGARAFQAPITPSHFASWSGVYTSAVLLVQSHDGILMRSHSLGAQLNDIARGIAIAIRNPDMGVISGDGYPVGVTDHFLQPQSKPKPLTSDNCGM